MSNVFINESTMTEIGNAIRSKTGKADLILPQNMPSEIEGIKSEGTELLNSVLDRTVKDIYIDAPVTYYAFAGCKSIKPTFGDKCTSIGESAFQSCSKLTEINTNKVTYLGHEAFYSASNLIKADLPSVVLMSSSVFTFTKLEILILRANKMCSISNINLFTSTPIAKGTGYIYVPKALLEQYKTATNWVTYANQFRAIEDYPEITEVNN